MNDWTIQKLLSWVTQYFTEKGLESPRVSAELLVSDVLKLKRIELYTQFDKPVGKEHLEKLRGLVKRAGEHEPIAYLIGKCEFYCLEFNITPACLIPRPETELLVERAIEFLQSKEGEQFVCDLCTGSGCIAVAIAKNYANAKIIATDISSDVLEVAEQNVEKYQLGERVKLLHGDLFEPLIQPLDRCEFDLIICNPPYVTSGEFEKLDKNVREYEPKSALLAGVDGLDIYRRIAQRVEEFLKEDSALMLEIGYRQGAEVTKLLEDIGIFSEVVVHKDYHDNDRIVIARRGHGAGQFQLGH